MNIGTVIGEIRKSKGIKQVFISQKTGISPTKLSLAEKGKRKLSSEEFLKICKAIDVDAKTIISSITNLIEKRDKKNDKEQMYKELKPDLTSLLELLLSDM